MRRFESLNFIHVYSSRVFVVQLFLGAFGKLRTATVSFVMSIRPSVRASVYPHATTRLPLDGFCWNLLFETFSKICTENSRIIKIRQNKRELYTKTFPHLPQYLADFSLQWDMLKIKVVEKFKTHILCSITFLSEYCAVCEIMSKNMVEPEGPQVTSYGAYALHAGKARLHACARAYTHRQICNTDCFFAATIFTRTRLSVTLFVHCLSCWVLLKDVNTIKQRTMYSLYEFVLSILHFLKCYLIQAALHFEWHCTPA